MALISNFWQQPSFIVTLTIMTLVIFFYSSDTQYKREEIREIIQAQREQFSQVLKEAYHDGLFDDGAIKDLCHRANWTENLIVSCGAPQGGVGNVRNVFLNCVRYAIEAGATGFVIPEIILRNQKDISQLSTSKTEDFDYLFDRSHFVTTLGSACPRLKLWSDFNDLYNIPSAANPLILAPQSLTRTFVQGVVLGEPSKWRSLFDRWLQDHNATLTPRKPTVVELATPLLQWPILYDGEAVARTFGRILRFREDTRRLAATVLYELSGKYDLGLRPNARITKNAFYGAHLRTAHDAAKAGWPGYSAQAPRYLAQAVEYGLHIVYVTSESAPDVEQFRIDGQAMGLNITTKRDLLSGLDLAELEALTWDQQALVDYEVLLKSSKFGGLDKSSFAWNIALRRHGLTGEVGDEYLRRKQTLLDGLSLLVGFPGSMAMIPLSMWP